MARTTGTGDIIALDFSQNMLDIGAAKINDLQLQDQIRLVRGNAMSLPFENDTFDYVTIGFGLRNVPDYVQVLQEMRRVVKPGGKVVCLDTSKPTWQPFKGIYYLYFERILPLFGKMFAGKFKEYKWLPDSLKLFPDAKQLKELFQKAGMEKVDVKLFFGGVAALHMGTKGKEEG